MFSDQVWLEEVEGRALCRLHRFIHCKLGVPFLGLALNRHCERVAMVDGCSGSTGLNSPVS